MKMSEFTISPLKYLVPFVLIFPSLALAVDDATVQAIDSKASSANSKANGNNSRIQALEAADEILNNRIDNIQLTPGPAGPQGPTGADGPQGPAGADGVAGADGLAGADGAQGPAGLTGATGSTGATGPQGATGADGAKGDTGSQGIQGIQGEQGIPGLAGTNGTNGIDGVDGVDGGDGAQGPPGPQGDPGADGADGAQGPAGADGVAGPAGPAGADGAGPIVETRSPEAFDDINGGYSVGTIWVDTIGGEAYIMIDNTPGIANWKQITSTNIYQVGDEGPAGGTVFYVTDDGLHGLEAAPNDSPSAPWGCLATDINGADGTAIGTGQQNTADILADCTESPIAADVAGTTINGVLGWFLPSKDELNELYLNQGVVGGFASNVYWSSSEVDDLFVDDLFARLQVFVNGFQTSDIKSNTYGVRAVRAF